MSEETTVDLEEYTEPGATKAAPSSPLASLRERRRKAEAGLPVDLVVPRYDPPIYVRYVPVPQGLIEAENKKAEKSKDRDATTIANAVVLAHGCRGVFQVVDGEQVSIDPEASNPTDDSAWPRFDERLAQLLELAPGASAVDVVRGLYLTDGDVIATGIKLAIHSGYDEVDERRDF